MGFLEDLVKTIQEAAEEARAGQRQKNKSSPEWTPPEQEQRQRAQVVRRHREQREQATTQGEQTAAPAARPAREARPTAPPRPAPTGVDRLRRLLHQQHTLRELILLREILDRPLALRGPITRRFPPR